VFGVGHRLLVRPAHDGEAGVGLQQRGQVGRKLVPGARDGVLLMRPASPQLVCVGGLDVDEAIRLHEPLESFLRQAKDEVTGLNEGYRQLEQILRDLETER